MEPRQLTLLPVAPGPEGVSAVASALRTAMAGGPAVAILTDHVDAVAGVGEPRTEWHDTAVVLATSGSTGQPLLVELGATALQAARDLGAAALGAPGLWLTALPITGIGGLLTVARSLAAGLEPVPWPGVGGAGTFTADSFAAAVRDTRARADAAGVPCFTSLVPTQVLRLARAGALDCLTGFDHVLIGGDALAPGLRRLLDDQGVRCTSTYGATETCGGVVYDGRPLPGVDIRLAGPTSGSAGEGAVEVGGPTIAHGYRGRPDLTARRFPQGRFRSSDLGRWAGGRLVVSGRTDDVVQVGGTKVSLSAVTDVLREHPAVLDALVVARPDAEWGTAATAFVVPGAESGTAPLPAGQLAAALKTDVAARLGRRSVPREIQVVAVLPEAVGGKADRRAGGVR